MSNAGNRPPVVFAPAALRDLDQIFTWNEKTYGSSHAYNYLDFLVSRIHGIGKDPAKGHLIEQRSDVRYQLIRRGKKGHGHIAVYRVEDHLITIVHVFHTAQDWPSKLAEEL